jgi:hypothetical protein
LLAEKICDSIKLWDIDIKLRSALAMTNPKLRKWLIWMQAIKGEVQSLVSARRIHHEMGEMIAANSLLPKTSPIYGYFGGMYTSHAVMALRRQLKIGADQISIARLFSEMIEAPECITRQYFRSLYEGSDMRGFADQDFDKFAAVGKPYVDPSLVQADLTKLRNETRRCEDFADKCIAHRDKRAPKQFPTYFELDSGIGLLDELYVKYHLLFYAQNMRTLLPTRQYDWTEVFRVPWMASN